MAMFKLTLFFLTLVVPIDAGTCNLTGDWLLNIRLNTSAPSSLATIIHVDQAADGSFTVKSSDPSITTWRLQTGRVWPNRHVEARPEGSKEGFLSGTVQPECSLVFWQCGAPFSQSCGQDAPSQTWHRVDHGAAVVHVLFFTHFDVGYTKATSMQVLDQYFNEWFPKAFNTSRQLRARGGPERFHWTTHPWLLSQFFANTTGNVTQKQVNDMIVAIEEGSISWHAGPFNLQAETAEPTLYRFGFSLAADLDRRFNKSKKTFMNQKDVPGSTIGMVPFAAQAGIKTMHVGVNDFSNPPAVPYTTPEMYEPCHTFLWRAPASPDATPAELVCFWCAGYSQGYGPNAGTIPETLVSLSPFGSNHALAFLMTVDNRGPQTVEEVLEGWRNLRLLFPNAEIRTSSLDEFTEQAWAARHRMPVVTDEVGDTWIRGTAADPTKARRYRVVARTIAAALERGAANVSDKRVADAYTQLIKLPEHTYGSNDNLVNEKPFDNEWLDGHIGDSDFQTTVAGFRDPRAYIDRAVVALADHPLHRQVEEELAKSEPSAVDLSGLVAWPLDSDGAPVGTVQCGGLELAFDSTGAMSTLRGTNRQWADAEHTLARFRYRSHSEAEFAAYGERYMTPGCRPADDESLCSFGKPGLSKTGAVSKDWAPRVEAAWRDVQDGRAHCELVISFAFPLEAQTKYGAPSVANLTVTSTQQGQLLLDLQYHKRPTRMAESLWLSFAPRVGDVHGWRLAKLGQSIDPFAVVVNGSRAMHAVWEGITYHEPAPPKGHAPLADRKHPVFSVSSLDAPIVAVDEPSPIVYLREQQIEGKSWHFNLFNNAWNTNYPVWEIDSNQRFRFILAVQPSPPAQVFIV